MGHKLGTLETLPESAERETDESTRLLHELQVHQIELEMQNEELRRYRLELEESRDRFANLFASSPIGYLCLDPGLLVTESNAAALSLFGQSPDQLTGRTLSRFLCPEDTELFHLHCREVFHSRQSASVILRWILQDSSIHSLQLHSVLVPSLPSSQKERKESLQIAFLDISAKVQEEAMVRRYQMDLESRVRSRTLELEKSNISLQKAEQQFRMLLEAAPDASLILDHLGSIVLVNLQLERLFGYSRKELLGRSAELLMPPRYRDKGLSARGISQMKGEPQTIGSGMTLNGLRKDGSEFPLELSMAPIEGIDGRLLSVSIRDLTERQRLQIELRKLSSAVNQSRSTIIISDPKGVVEYVNRRFTEVTGYGPQDILGKTPSLLSSETTPKETYSNLWTTIQSAQEWRGTIQNKRKNGEAYWEELCVSPILDESGAISHFLGVGEDISIRKAFEDRQGILLAELDHRVKNTLSVVLSIAKQTIRTSKNLKEFRVSFEGRLMALAQVHRLLTKNRWDSVTLEDLISVAVKPYCGPEGPIASIQGPEVRLGPKDAQSIHLIFHELSTNAAKYGAFVVPQGRVTVTWKTAETDLGITTHLTWVESNGPSIVPATKNGFGHELISHIIEAGMGGKSVMSFPATGLEWRAEFSLPKHVPDLISYGTLIEVPDHVTQ